MAFRIGSHVIAGELFNLRRNCVHGWLAWGPDEGIRIELAGNLTGELAGRHFRFETKSPAPVEDCPRAELETLQVMQNGVVGESALRMVRIPTVPIEEYAARAKQGLPLPEVVRPSLYLEWFSQNGHVIAEIADIEFVFDPPDEPPEPEPLPEASESGGPGIVGLVQGDDGRLEEVSLTGQEADDEADRYGLFPGDLDASLQSENDAAAPLWPDDADDPTAKPEKRPWDEVIPGLDPETKRMYEEWDEVIDGDKDQPLDELFDPPLRLKPFAEIENEAEAESWLKVLLARLALHAVAIDICEHYSAQATYRWLLEEILPGCKLHPRAGKIGFMRHYCTWETCPECEAKFDAEYNARNPEARP